MPLHIPAALGLPRGIPSLLQLQSNKNWNLPSPGAGLLLFLAPSLHPPGVGRAGWGRSSAHSLPEPSAGWALTLSRETQGAAGCLRDLWAEEQGRGDRAAGDKSLWSSPSSPQRWKPSAADLWQYYPAMIHLQLLAPLNTGAGLGSVWLLALDTPNPGVFSWALPPHRTSPVCSPWQAQGSGTAKFPFPGSIPSLFWVL